MCDFIGFYPAGRDLSMHEYWALMADIRNYCRVAPVNNKAPRPVHDDLPSEIPLESGTILMGDQEQCNYKFSKTNLGL